MYVCKYQDLCSSVVYIFNRAEVHESTMDYRGKIFFPGATAKQIRVSFANQNKQSLCFRKQNSHIVYIRLVYINARPIVTSR